ncbi:DUF485 domain-containing protein [Microbacterium paludicola]|uniref:DUF485 domain-containing protein n=1 Tax=Microbacterium paludicola TaxID=300019 RepID=A0A4Y9FS85_9MICO|nr:DUF485 domain-containing protein [Microbacterium paludicola]MBF0817467.1 DUF485 domain-containing protein [Microbacterium paludicola]TFU31119.1 DUF485 domain-containing protein [Microbacterium paludicola]
MWQGGLVTDTPPGAPTQGRIDYIAEENSPRFRELKRTHRSFVFPLSVFFLVWYFVYVLLAGWAKDFMAQPVFGDMNVGLLIGLGQFVTTLIITLWYVRFANSRLDPKAAAIREDLEKQETGA